MKAETLEKYNNIVALIDSGLSVLEVADKMGISKQCVYNACGKMGHKFACTVNDLERHHAYIVEQRTAGFSSQDIADALGYTKSNIKQYCKKHNIRLIIIRYD